VVCCMRSINHKNPRERGGGQGPLGGYRAKREKKIYVELSKRIVVYKKHQYPRRVSFLFCGSIQNDIVFGVISVRINIYSSITHAFCFLVLIACYR